MRARTFFVVVAILALGAGSFFAGRASDSKTLLSTSTTSPSTVVEGSFSPLSVDFSSVVSGWALGTSRCHAHSVCLTLSTTTNAGRSWTSTPLPKALLHLADRRVDGKQSIRYAELYGDGIQNLNVQFANAEDGWIFGSLAVSYRVNGQSSFEFHPVLWSTHDGGIVWTSHPQSWMYPQGAVLALDATSHTVYLMAQNKNNDVTVESSPVGVDRWRTSDSKGLYTPAGGGPLSGSFVFSGSHGWLVEGNDRGVTGSARLSTTGQWIPWRPPCAAVGDSMTVPAASSSKSLIALCVMGGFASPLTSAAPPGAKLGSTWLYRSDNAGRSFTASAELGPDTEYFGPELASPSVRTSLVTSQGRTLIASFDAGRHWSTVYSGDVMFLHFISSNEGVALVQRPHRPNRLIMTFDGGHEWLPIPF